MTTDHGPPARDTGDPAAGPDAVDDHDHCDDHDRGHAHGGDHRDEAHAHGRGSHDHDDGPGHGGGLGAWWHKLSHLVTPNSHDSADKVDAAVETSRDGIRALWISLAVLGATAVVQAVVVVLSHSVALLGDTLHNVADALTAVPLGIAFVVGRRAATRRYTYGYGRAEDLAGIVIVAFIAASSAPGMRRCGGCCTRRRCRICRLSRGRR
jgi:Cation efflux family